VGWTVSQWLLNSLWAESLKENKWLFPHQVAAAMIQGFGATENWEEKAREAHEVPRDRL
jgi:hypothetical protein